MFNVLFYNNASASGGNSEYYNNIQVNSSDEEVGANGIGAVLIFLGGIAAGYIIDGVLIRYTGHSGGEWVAKALSFNRQQPTCQNIHFSSSTGTPRCYSGSGGKF